MSVMSILVSDIMKEWLDSIVIRSKVRSLMCSKDYPISKQRVHHPNYQLSRQMLKFNR